MHALSLRRGWRVFAVLAALAVTAGALVATMPSAEAEVAAAARPKFRMPFLCGQTWTGSNWNGHKPPHSIDWNHYNAKGQPDDFGRRVVASAGGKVLASYYAKNNGYGHTIVIGHGNGWRTRYAHLSKRLVSKGQKVAKGKVIGRVGKSSAKYNLSPHLHYEQKHNGSVVVAIVEGVKWKDGLKRKQKAC